MSPTAEVRLGLSLSPRDSRAERRCHADFAYFYQRREVSCIRLGDDRLGWFGALLRFEDYKNKVENAHFEILSIT